MIGTKELRRLAQAALAVPDGLSVEWMDRLGQFQEAADASVVSELLDRLEAAEKERDSARDLADRLALALNTSNHERDDLRAKIAEMERQEPVGTLHDDGCFVWRETAPHQSNYAGWKMALYALPGAKGEDK